MIEIGKNAKIKVHWNVLSYDYKPDKIDEIRTLMANKYGKSKDDINVVPDVILPSIDDAGGLFSKKTVEDVQNPESHKLLFKKYLDLYNIKDYDFDAIEAIDNEVNSEIEYNPYNKYRKFSIKWIKWSNFESYGPDNSFDFSTLHGLVLLNGEPANQSGKTTFAVDLLHFLLFGESGKYPKQEELFNYMLPEETQLWVEGCITIDGEDYIIKRTITRPALSKRTEKSRATQKVEYYRLIGDTAEELQEYVEENGVDTRETNKIIKESIGNKNDFDLMMCITGKKLDALIDDTPTNRGKLLSRWVGLSSLENKDIIARSLYNSKIKPMLLSNRYNKEDLKIEIEAYKKGIEECEKKVYEYNETNKKIDGEIASLEEKQEKLFDSKKSIDEDVLKLDIVTIQKEFNDKKNEGIAKKAELDKNEKEIQEIGNVEYSKEEHDTIKEDNIKIRSEVDGLVKDFYHVKELIRVLKNGEICPTCKRKLDNVDNSDAIKENENKLREIEKIGGEKKLLRKESDEKLMKMEKNFENYTRLNTLMASQVALNNNIDAIRSRCDELKKLKSKYLENSEAIDRNMKIDQQIAINKENLKSKHEAKTRTIELLFTEKNNIKNYKNEIEQREKLILQLESDIKLENNWNIYLEMVGKNGISKMVLRELLPTINAIIAQLLDDVCDFSVTVDINSKNEVAFYLIRDGITQNIDSASGFEKTVSALAVRCALLRMSTMSRMNFLIFDEIFGRVASVNYDNMKLLYDRILEDYDFIFNITHIDALRDWHNTFVTVTKTNGISKLQQITNTNKKINKIEVPKKQAKKKISRKKTTKND